MRSTATSVCVCHRLLLPGIGECEHIYENPDDARFYLDLMTRPSSSIFISSGRNRGNSRAGWEALLHLRVAGPTCANRCSPRSP